MQKLIFNNVDIEININAISNFLNKIQYPIMIFDFETFRNLIDKKKVSSYANDFEKIFSKFLSVITKQSDLTPNKLPSKISKLFVKTLIPEWVVLKNNDELIKFQHLFFKLLLSKLLKYNIKSLVVLGARTETLLLKNYLAYYVDKSKFKNKINYFFNHSNIFDLYDIWNKDNMFNLPLYKKIQKHDVGATKKTILLIKNNHYYAKILKPQSLLTNNDIGRIIDQYFANNICLLPNFKTQVANHNQNDVLIGAAILSVLYDVCNTF